ncbi:hypothetical protein ACEPAG_1779 [Sanghuangporus baumii]
MPSSSHSSAHFKLRSLPIIDIAPWIAPVSARVRGHNGGRRSTAAALHAACLTYGFFYLDVSSYVEKEELEELSELARRFFALPQEEKDKIGLGNQDGARGYQRLKENVTNGKADNHEGIDFYAPVEQPDKNKPLHGENQWPSDEIVPGFQERYERWVEKMKKLGMIVMEAMSVGLGMTTEEWLDLKGKVDNSFWVMRVIGYPPLPNDFDGFSCGAHKDYGCLTFLYADPTPNALQVFLPQTGILDDAATTPIPAASTVNLAPSAASALIGGVEPSDKPRQPMNDEKDSEVLLDEVSGEEGVWINADPLPGCVVCNIGEMWEIWTNGLYKSTLHRVVHTGSNYRIPFFFEPNFDAQVAPLAAALRLQKDSIQPAYAYQPHTPHIPYPHCHHNQGEPAETLAQRLKELALAERLSAPPSSASSDSSSVYSIPVKNGKDSGANSGGEDADSDRATTGSMSVRSTLSTVSNGTKGADKTNPHTPRTPYTPISHTHVEYKPISVEKHYAPVVYGEFLMKKVGNNFATGKGKYD